MTHPRDFRLLPGTSPSIAALCSAMLLCASAGCTDKAPPPVAQLAVYPPVGDTTILFECSAAKSADETFYHVALRFRWDFNGDLDWDTGYSEEPIVVRYFPDPGTFPVAVEVINPDGKASIAYDTVTVYGRNRLRSNLTDPRDGQAYRTVYLKGRWWLAESLRYGTVVDPWTTGMTDNGIPERVEVNSCWYPGTWSVYSWFEAMNYDPLNSQGICPDGWHLPSKKEWESLYAGIPMAFSGQYYGKGGLSGLELQDGLGAEFRPADSMYYCNDAHYWSSSRLADETGLHAGSLLFVDQQAVGFGYVSLSGVDQLNNWRLWRSVRCIKNGE